MNINDWKIIQMRNDVKYIKRNAVGNNAANWSLVIDVFLVLLAFVLDRIVDNPQEINALWIVIGACGIIFPVVLFAVQAIKTKHAEEISRRVLNTKELVEIFDDEICYMIMSAETFNKNLQNSSEVDSRQKALMLEFYTIEVEYYLNKAVKLLLKMDNNLSGVLNTEDITQNHISKPRLINSISLIVSLYEELFKFVEKQEGTLKKYSVQLNLAESKDYYKSLKSFATRRKDLIGIDVETTFEFGKERN